MNLAQITKAMQTLEINIAKEQKHIALHGAANDLDSDKQWVKYKEQAAQNLAIWDSLKAKRDTLKGAIA